ncbi:MAG TPA: hypothetical protein VNM45_02165 [Bacillus sp. (in: firmicutes)]|nr:hypothetical protein [Bacillus sp. (in: firmicutes)]
MGRGKNFNHKQKGHEPEIPKHGQQVQAKRHEQAVFNFEPVASEDTPPVSIQVIEE